jgi:hypothetical protein
MDSSVFLILFVVVVIGGVPFLVVGVIAFLMVRA